MTKDDRVVARNRKAAHDYFLEEHFEAGLVLLGSEIKSIRSGQVSLREAYVQIQNHEAWLVGAHIAPYHPASHLNHDPTRQRKLLLNRQEIRKLEGKVAQRGYTIVPTKLYLKRGKAKIEIALAKGKRKYDKRKQIAKRDEERRLERLR